MNSFMDYVCRGIVRSEDAIRCLNKRVTKIAKSNTQLATAVISLNIACLGMTAVLWAQDNKIKALRNQASKLDKDIADIQNYTDYLAKTMEEKIQQEGA